MSATVRVSTPSIPSEESPRSGAAEIRPRAGFRPTSPQQAAGIRIEPPPSLPCATGTIPDATAARSTARGTAGGSLQIPRIARRAEDPGLADRQDPVLGQRRRAHDHEARPLQTPHHIVVVGRDEIFHQRAAVCVPPVLQCAVVLDRNRHARERALVARAHLVRGRQRPLVVDLDERVQLRVELLDPRQARSRPARAKRHLRRAPCPPARSRDGTSGRCRALAPPLIAGSFIIWVRPQGAIPVKQPSPESRAP